MPPEGVLEAEFREAKTTELYALVEMVRGKLKEVIQSTQLVGHRWVNIKAIYPDAAVVQLSDGRYMSYPYQIAEDNAVAIGTPSEVIEQFVPATMREAAATTFVEAVEGEKDQFLIRVIQAGLSRNRAYYPAQVLREAVPLFNGARVFAKSDDDHLQGKGKDARNILGRLSDAKFIEGPEKDTGEIQAVLTLLNGTSEIATVAFTARLKSSFAAPYTVAVKGHRGESAQRVDEYALLGRDVAFSRRL